MKVSDDKAARSVSAIVLLLATLSGAALSGCDAEPAKVEPQPIAQATRADRSDITSQMRTARALPLADADGGGSARIASGPGSVIVGSLASWTFTYEAGPLGIADGGTVVFMVSPFWGWSAPQFQAPDLPGYTTARTDADGVELEVTVNAPPMMGVTIRGRDLREGEQIHIDYGGEVGARSDRYAEARSRFWFGVDGDGDGRHQFLPDSPSVEVLAGPPRRLVVLAPTVVGVGETVPVRISAVDATGNIVTKHKIRVVLSSAPEGAVEEEAVIEESDRGSTVARFTPASAGVYRIAAIADDGIEALSNPIVASESGTRIYWADLHGHSALSDGTGSPEQYFRYARDVAALDIAALTDHDHWGVLHLDQNPSLQAEIERQVRAFHAPGSFVTLPGYEWTSWISGHRHVLYFDEQGPLLSSIDEDFDTPQKLWQALRGKAAVTVAHHSAGGPIATDWTIVPDPILEPITEVVSVHGVSEAADSPSVIYKAKPHNFVRDALARGYRFGFVGSGDSHDGHPGLAHLGSGGTGGVAAILAKSLTRAAVLEAIRQRRVYATSGPRIFLRTALGEHPMGSTVAASALANDPPPSLYVRAIGTAPIEWLDLVRSGEVARTEVGASELETVVELSNLGAGEYVYVRIVQSDGGLAWSSPIYIE